MNRLAPGVILPSPHDHIDVRRVELEAVAAPAKHLSSNERRTAAEKGVVHRIPWLAVIADGARHALDGFLRPMAPGLLAMRIAERVVVRDRPYGRLLAVAGPVGGS